jgi:signal transduction histidine kinase
LKKPKKIDIKEGIRMNLNILKSSSKMLKYFVRDMLDFQQIKANKMKKDISVFNIKDAVDEVLIM